MPDRLDATELKDWLHSLIDCAMDATITVDETQKILVFNRAAEDIFKIKAADALGQPFEQFIPERFRDIHKEHFERFAGSSEPAHSTHSPALVGTRTTGEEFPFEATVFKMKTKDRTLFTVLLRDVSARRQIEQQVMHLQKMEALGRLAGGIAHDFNNLLMIIRANIETMIEDDEPERNRRRMHTVLDAIERGTALVSQLLIFSRQRPREFAPVNVNTLLSEVEKMVPRLIGEDIKLVINWGRRLETVKADAHQLFQVLINLIVNAKDAMPNGGKITIGAEMATLDEYYVRQHPDAHVGEYVMVSVSDTGTGMPPSVKERMFDPFFTTKAEGKGTGLGLSLVMGTVRACNGHITVYTEIGQGTVINLFFPVPVKRTHERQNQKEAPIDGAVLIVEDESALRNIICEVLVSHGFSVLEATNGNDALAIAKRHHDRIQVVVTDVVMPEMGGIELIRRLKNIVPNFGVVLMSGYHEVTESEETIGARKLHKPFAVHDLVAAIRDVARKE